jgi:Fe2+ transport system protein B
MTFPALPDDAAAGFAERRAPLTERLAGYPHKQLSDEIAGMEEELAGLGSDAPRAAELRAGIDSLAARRDAMPPAVLQAEIARLAEQMESLPEDPAAVALRAQIEKHAEALERLAPGDAGAEILRRQMDGLTAALEKTPSGTLGAAIADKQEELDALPEKRLEAQITEIDNEEAAEALRRSYAGRLGVALERFTAPAGFDWRTNIALIGGIAAKEVVVSTLGTAYALGEVGEEDHSLARRIATDSHWTMANAVALLLFTLLYSPCFVTLVMIKQESGAWRWLFFSLVFNLALAYGVAVAAFQALS